MSLQINKLFNNPGDRKSIVDCCVEKDMFACRGNLMNPDSRQCKDAMSDICDSDIKENKKYLSNVCGLYSDVNTPPQDLDGEGDVNTPPQDLDGEGDVNTPPQDLDGVKMKVRLNARDSDLLPLHTKSVSGSSSDSDGMRDTTKTIIVVVVVLFVFCILAAIYSYYRKKSGSTADRAGSVDISTSGGTFPI